MNRSLLRLRLLQPGELSELGSFWLPCLALWHLFVALLQSSPWFSALTQSSLLDAEWLQPGALLALEALRVEAATWSAALWPSVLLLLLTPALLLPPRALLFTWATHPALPRSALLRPLFQRLPVLSLHELLFTSCKAGLLLLCVQNGPRVVKSLLNDQGQLPLFPAGLLLCVALLIFLFLSTWHDTTLIAGARGAKLTHALRSGRRSACSLQFLFARAVKAGCLGTLYLLSSLLFWSGPARSAWIEWPVLFLLLCLSLSLECLWLRWLHRSLPEERESAL